MGFQAAFIRFGRGAAPTWDRDAVGEGSWVVDQTRWVLEQRRVSLRVNGQMRDMDVPVHATLAQVLRDQIGLTGTKIACDQAACGACTIMLDGRSVFSCHLLAAQAHGRSVETVEGLADRETLHPLQAAFVAHDALQCGFCTPGMLLAIVAALRAHGTLDRAGLIAAISGNLCRCGAYPHIIDAALSVMDSARSPA